MQRARYPYGGALVLWVVTLVGCGYHLSGHPTRVPGYLRTVAVPMFSNTTAVPGLEYLFTAAVREHFQRDGRVRVRTEEGSTTLLRGEITRYQLRVLATNRDDRALEYRVETEVRVSLEDRRLGKIVLQHPVVTTTEYLVFERLVPSEIAQQRALEAAAHAAGERVVSLLLDGF